jgi:hypothetical protein
MKRLLLVLALVVVGGVGLGFYLGWFHIATNNDKSNVTLSVDADKFKKDEKAAADSVNGAVRRVEDGVAGASEKKLVGTVVSVSGGNLKMTDEAGKEHSQALAGNVKVTCDGKTCTIADLKAGMRVRVTTDKADQPATRIEALDNNREFEKGA